MELKRSSGVLLHPTSLPGPYGIGDLGAGAVQFLDFLAAAGQRWWQVLPLNPPSGANSPYKSFSAFAGNPLLISPDTLVRDGLLDATALKKKPKFPADRVDYEAVTKWKTGLLHQAWERFSSPDFPSDEAFKHFCHQHAAWLDDYALFMALKDAHDGAEWNAWEPELAQREDAVLRRARHELAPQIGFYQFVQYLFYAQHSALKREAATRGIGIIGDLPIFVAHNSADVWAHPELFHLDENGQATIVAGVPPDYFSKTGQLWGNPLYDWDAMKKDDYAWWAHRLQMALHLYDLVRIDHFRGLESFWAIPASDSTAIGGKWQPGPGAPFFKALKKRLGDLPIIAEDLGLITPEVEALRDGFDLPGMKVLQFAFSDADNVYLPHNYANHNCIVYTGTHDNNTSRGWWESAPLKERRFARLHLPHLRRQGEVSWELTRLAFASVAKLAIVPLQDVLSLGAEGRMNTPGVDEGNWGWRFGEEMLASDLQERLLALTKAYGRLAPLGTTLAQDHAARHEKTNAHVAQKRHHERKSLRKPSTS